jgi:hypothetical protein
MQKVVPYRPKKYRQLLPLEQQGDLLRAAQPNEHPVKTLPEPER